MKKILALSIMLTVFSSCMHMGSGHGGMKCGCDKGKPCATECADKKADKADKDGKSAECDDCKKAK